MPVSLRAILKNWKLSAIAAFSLTVAMALGVVGFSISNTALFRLPAAKDPARMVTIFSNTARERFQNISYPDYEFYRGHNRSFTDVAGFPFSIGMNAIRVADRVELAAECAVTDNYFSVMGLRPLLGRFFEPGDDRNHQALAVLTYAGWTRWNRDPNLIGHVAHTLDHHPVTIIGVAPKEFTGSLLGFGADLIVNFWDWHDEDFGRDSRRLILLGSLKPGVSMQQARAELATLSATLARDSPKQDGGHVADLVPATMLPPDGISDARLICGLLLIVIVFILLIACANAANLLLAIATGRRREALIKLALGSSRARLIREFLAETGILCVISAVCGFALASMTLQRLSDFQTTLPGFGLIRIASNLHPDWVVFAATAAMVTIATAATGIAPAMYGSSVSLAGALTGETAIGGTKKGVIRNGLVIIQVAISTVVLVGVGLCYRSIHNLRSVDTGFSARNLVGVQMWLEREGFTEEKGLAAYAVLREAARKIPGVEAVSIAEGMPMEVGYARNDIRVDAAQPPVNMRGALVDDEYFSAAGIRILSGRAFDASDHRNTPEVTILSLEAARRVFHDADPIGRMVRIDDGKRTARVVGVAADVKVRDLDETLEPMLYFPIEQHANPYLTLFVRTRGDPRFAKAALEQAARAVNAQTPLPPKTMDDVMDMSLLVQIWVLEGAVALSTLALFLSVLGLFGAVSYAVGERRRELGIRIALGALPAHLLNMVLRQTLAVTGIGIVIGSALGIAVSVLLRSQFFGVRAVEWFAIAPVALAMLAVAILTAYFGAWRALHLDPMDTLRHS
jgi:predicted permease